MIEYNITESTVEIEDPLPVCVTCGLESEVLIRDDLSPLEDTRCPDCWVMLRRDEPKIVSETIQYLEAIGAL